MSIQQDQSDYFRHRAAAERAAAEAARDDRARQAHRDLAELHEVRAAGLTGKSASV